MDTRKSKKNKLNDPNNQVEKLTYKKYKSNQEVFDFIRMMDIVVTMQDTLKLMTTQTVYSPYIHSYDSEWNKHQDEENLEKLDELINDLFDEVSTQTGNELHRNDWKAILRGVKQTIVNQLSRSDARAWKRWERNASEQMVHQSSLDDFYDNYGYGNYGYGNYKKSKAKAKVTKKGTYTKSVATTAYTNRPNKILNYNIIVREEIAQFIRLMMFANQNEEWGVAFTWTLNKKKKEIYIDKVYIMPVTTGGTHVTFINESEYIIFADISELGEFVKDVDNVTRFAGIMHSHHTMGSFHSSTDHGTIATYIADFQSVLSMVWSWNKRKESQFVCDTIMKTKTEGFLLKNIEFEFPDDKTQESTLVTRYDDMVKIVLRDMPKWDRIMKQFEKSGKYLEMEKLYNQFENEELTNDTLTVLKQLM